MKKVKANSAIEGDGVEIKRLMPVHGLMNHDPFVLMDHVDVHASGGFPEHPHRGFEAITYMMDGAVQHKDNLGNQSTVTSGGLQRFTAGKGIVHSEITEGHAKGIQLWINLPKRLKQIDPDYQQVDAEHIPVDSNDGVVVRTLVGDGSPTLLQTPVLYLDVSMKQERLFQRDIPSGFRGFVYVLEGELKLNDERLQTYEALLFDEAKLLSFIAKQDSRFIICFGAPHGEPIYQHGTSVD